MKRALNRTSEVPHQYRWVIFSVLALQFIFVYFHRVSFAVVAPELVKAFDISGTALGVLAAGYFYTYACMQLPVGLLVDSWGPRKTVSAFTLIAGLAAILFGLSPGFGMATFARILVGLGVSTVFVSSMKVFTYWFHGREYARVSGLFLAVGGVGWLMAATPLAVLSRWFGWRTVFMAIGVITVLLTAITWSVIRDKPEEDCPEHDREGEAQNGKRTIAKNIRQVLGERYFWPLAIWSFTDGGILFGFFGLWAGPYLMEAHGLSKTVAGNVLSMVAMAMIFGSPVIGYITDKVVKSRKAILLCSSVIHLLCWTTLLICHKTMPQPFLYVMFFVMGVTSCAIPVVLLTATRELFPGEIAGTGQGIMNLFPFVGSMVFQPMLGFILDRTRSEDGHYVYENAFWFLLIACVVGIASLLFMKGTARNS
jgi:sugar phosphate permease